MSRNKIPYRGKILTIKDTENNKLRKILGIEKVFHCSQVGRINIMEMATLSRLISRFNLNSHQNSN